VIAGSTVNATQQSATVGHGAGIGTGGSGNTGSDAGPAQLNSLTITGSTVVASAQLAAGIGPGEANGGSSSVSAILVDNSNVSASSSSGAGIGAAHAYYAGSFSLVNFVSIVNSTVDADSETGAAVGAGAGQVFGNSTVASLAIALSNVTARSSQGAGIGSGMGNYGQSSVMNITIRRSAVSGFGVIGAGIGAGTGNIRGLSFVGNLSIMESAVRAEGMESAGIGAGASNSSVSFIWLRSSAVSAAGSVAIGGSPAQVMLEGNLQLNLSSSDRASGIEAAAIEVGAVDLFVWTQAPLVFPRLVSLSSPSNVTIFYETAANSREPIVGIPLLELGSISLPFVRNWLLTFDSAFSILYDSSQFAGIALSFPIEGIHQVFAQSDYCTVALSSGDSYDFAASTSPPGGFYDSVRSDACPASPFPTQTALQSASMSSSPPATPSQTPLQSQSASVSSSPPATPGQTPLQSQSASPPASLSRSPTAASGTIPESNPASQIGVTVGIVTGCVVGVALVILVILCVFRNLTKRRAGEKQDKGLFDEPGSYDPVPYMYAM
jgi:hypothetical protein